MIKIPSGKTKVDLFLKGGGMVGFSFCPIMLCQGLQVIYEKSKGEPDYFAVYFWVCINWWGEEEEQEHRR